MKRPLARPRPVWNEDTAIEPVAPASATSTSGRRLYTQGYTYEGFGTTYLT
jgi:hypothetical protein